MLEFTDISGPGAVSYTHLDVYKRQDNDTVLYTSQDIHYNEKLMYFGVDVTGQNEIRVEVSLVTDNEWDDPIILIDGLSLYK